MNECEQIQRWISHMQDGELEPERREQVLAHVARCGECRGFLESLDTARQQLDTAIQNLDTATLDERFFEALARERGKKTRWWRMSIRVPLPVAAAAVAALVIALALLLRTPAQQRLPSSPSYQTAKTVVIGPEDVIKEVEAPL